MPAVCPAALVPAAAMRPAAAVTAGLLVVWMGAVMPLVTRAIVKPASPD